jgi:hypothetical protein
MAKIILTVDTRLPQATNTRRFVLDTENIVGLFKDVHGNTGVVFKPAAVAQPKSVYVTETFEELAETLQLENPNKTVVTVNHKAQQSRIDKFVLDVRKLVGVVENHLGTQLTIKTSENTVPTLAFVTEDFDEIASLYIDGPFDPELD